MIAVARQVLLICIQATAPFTAQTMIQQALPRNLEVYYCAPNSVALASVLAGIKCVPRLRLRADTVGAERLLCCSAP